MSKVQPNHNRGIMQTGLGQPPQNAVQQTEDEAEDKRKSLVREGGMGKREAKN